jgi:uridylate kinase
MTKASSFQQRILIKLSGEALAGPDGVGIHGKTLQDLVEDVIWGLNKGYQIVIAVGGGNFFRGIEGLTKGLDRPTADSIGMLATVMNALALEHALQSAGIAARALSAVPIPSLCESYTRRHAFDRLNSGHVIILGGGVGNPYFTTDTGAVLRAAELSCQRLLKATLVDGVYSADPQHYPNAKRYTHITYDQAIREELKVMDIAAFILARESAITITIFSILIKHALRLALENHTNFGTIVSP